MAPPSVPAIFEGAFLHKDVLVRADVLERTANGWSLIEVKSGTRVKEGVHDNDVAVQVWVLQGAGVNRARTRLSRIRFSRGCAARLKRE